MPRKQNGFGKSQSFAFKGNDLPTKMGRIDKCGTYPSNRRFGSLITRSPIDQFNIDSTWSMWRKGYEYYVKQKFVAFPLGQFKAEIFPSFTGTLQVGFEATRFPTSESDDATHYVLQRLVSPHTPFARCLAEMREVDTGEIYHSFVDDQNFNNERWQLVEYYGQPNLLKLGTESVTTKSNRPKIEIPGMDDDINPPQDKITNAIIKDILTIDKSIPNYQVKNLVVPAAYYGNSVPQKTTLTIRAVDIYGYDGTAGVVDPLTDEQLNQLIGKQISIFDAQPFYNVVSNAYSFEDIDETSISSSVEFRGSYLGSPCKFFVYDAKPLAEDTGIIYERDFLAIGVQANFGYGGEFVFDKSSYQRWFNTEFNAGLLEQLVEIAGPLIPTAMTIQSVVRAEAGDDIKDDENILIEVEPFTSQILYTKRPFRTNLSDRCYVMTNPKNSFTQEFNTFDENSGDLLKTKVNINVNTDLDETFVINDELWLQNRYSCDCPSYSKARLTAPEAVFEDGTLSANRQRRYPIPTAGANRDKTTIDNANDLAGIINTWITKKDREKFQCCKHTLSAYFADGKEIIEPNTNPMMRDRQMIEDEISKNIDDSLGADSIKRSELSATGFVWAVVQLMVQSTATIISRPPQDGLRGLRDSLRPLEFFYGFQKARQFAPMGSEELATEDLFEVKPGNEINIQ